MRPIINAQNITVKYANKTVLDNVCLEINEQEIITIIGPNGAGKTTLIKTLIGINKQYQGVISSLKDISIGYVPQKMFISPFMPITVLKFMTLNNQSDIEDVHNSLHKLQVCNLIDENLQQLSVGQLQRVLLARAILQKPQLLVLDEPAQGMDIGGQIAFYDDIKNIRDDLKCAIILVSHDLNLVMSATDKVVCINRHICCSGHPDAVAQAPEFAELFGDKAVESVALYRHTHNHIHGGEGVSCTEDHRHV